MSVRTIRLSLVLLVLGVSLAWPAVSLAAGPLRTAVFEPGQETPLVSARARAAGATAIRVSLDWSAVAPASRTAGFRPTDPADVAYRWERFDPQITSAVEAGLEPILTVVGAPAWAQDAQVQNEAAVKPDPAELGRFAVAVARRYSGTFEDLPRVRYWQVWNEPNISLFFRPQFVNGRPFSPGWYRRMVNEMSAAVKRVHADNLIIAGGTAPFRDITPEVQKVDQQWGPLDFMRELLCLSRSLERKCKQRVRFDIWSHHPYTSGGPTHHAALPDDVSLGDLPEMRRVLDAGVDAGNIVSKKPVRFWVTEFSWDSRPSDPKGVPTRLHTRWVAESLYRMWSSGVSLVTWFLLRDQPLSTSFYQSGLYYRGSTIERDRPKPALRAFRFPVVAIPDGRRVIVWGRTPAGLRGRVVVEQSFRGGWRRLALLTTDRHGIFQRRFEIGRVGAVRARLLSTGEKSVPFGVRPVPDRFFNPFGLPTLLEPRRP